MDSSASSNAEKISPDSNPNNITFRKVEMPEMERVNFFKALGLLLEGRTTWALFAIREDYLGALQPYLRFLPTQLSSRFRLTRLSIEDAALAIQMKEKVKRGEETAPRIAFMWEAALSLAKDLARNEGFAESASVVEPVFAISLV